MQLVIIYSDCAQTSKKLHNPTNIKENRGKYLLDKQLAWMYNTGIYSTPFLVLKGMADVPAGGYFFTGTKGPKFFIRSERSKRPDNLCLRFYNSGRFLGFSWDVCLKLMPYFLFGTSRNLKNIIIHTSSFLSFHSGVWKNYKEKKNSSYNSFSIFCNQVKIKTFS